MMCVHVYICVQVRLLTGIGRFYEMAYILQVLMENDQFESLLHTGLEKVIKSYYFLSLCMVDRWWYLLMPCTVFT